jgi:bifunctional non-homologous end joining protein LigD
MARAIEPMKATLSDRPFSDPAWVFERKLDGIRTIVEKENGMVTLTSRTGKPLTPAYPELVEALEAEPATDFVADGEIVAFDGKRTSFEKLQGRMGIHDPRLARLTGIPVFLYLFDLLEFDGHDLTGLPLRERKRVLRRALSFHDPVRYTPHRNERGEEFFREACAKGWEGLIAKRADSPYVHGRSRDWLKLKCSFEQELVIGGFTPPQGSRKHFGALLVGYYEGDELRYAGKVGTGFSEKTLAELGAKLESLEIPRSPFTRGSGLPRNARWVEPRLVGQFAFSEWTRDGKLRHPRYLGLREDKLPHEVVREVPTG